VIDSHPPGVQRQPLTQPLVVHEPLFAFSSDVCCRVRVCIQHDSSARHEVPAFRPFTEILVVVFDGLVIEKTTFGSMTFFLGDVRDTDPFAFRSQLVPEYPVWDLDEVLVVPFSKMYLLLPFLVLSNDNRSYPILDAMLHDLVDRLVHVIVDEPVPFFIKCFQPSRPFNDPFLVYFRLVFYDTFIVTVVVRLQPTTVHDERSSRLHVRASREVVQSDIYSKNLAFIDIYFHVTRLVNILDLEAIVSRKNPYLV